MWDPLPFYLDLALHCDAIIRERQYFYTSYLIALDSCRPTQTTTPMENITTGSPLVVTQWIQMLQDHPDKTYVQWVVKGIQQGFRIGFDRHYSCYPATANLSSQVPHIISEHLSKEVRLNKMWCCPLGSEPKGTQISPIGAIPKKNCPGKWRLITDLSSPAGKSVNDAISKELSSLKYTSVDHLSSFILSEGRGAFLVQADIKEDYRMVPIHRPLSRKWLKGGAK